MTRRPSTGGRPTKQQALALDDHIRSVAVATFAEKGFAGASMEEIARRAEISKPTLYARYSDKYALFMAVVPFAMETPVWEPPTDVASGGSLLDTLTTLARVFLDRVQDAQTIALLRVVISESGQFPELVMTSEDMARSPRVAATVQVFRRYAAVGEIVDAALAAEQFVALFSVAPMLFAMAGMTEPLQRGDDDLRRAVASFLDGARPR
jgi:AcrR family transcriptional regulator